jgi:putative phosphoribosyl transferase
MIFKNRQHAGQKLAQELADLAGEEDLLVLGVPRGGVPVAFEVAQYLHAPLDVFLSRKLGVPGQEELAFGAIAANGGRFLDSEIVAAAGLSPEEIEKITHATEKKLQERTRLYREGRPPLGIEGRTVILVDDGVATGASMHAAMQALRDMKPKRLIVAVPVASRAACNWLRLHADRLVALYAPESFYAVGQFYDDFSQVSDEEVIDLLQRADQAIAGMVLEDDCPRDQGTRKVAAENTHHEIVIKAGNVSLEGLLGLPPDAKGIVLFAHGSGSSRHSARNRYVADYLHSQGIATLLFDLLTQDEDRIDRRTSELRFNIDLLSQRLIEVTRWIKQNPLTKDLAVAYFGASTGAAAAFVAAAALPEMITAVLSRGGRPDLAGEALGRVRASSLLIVGSRDDQVVVLNREAFANLACQNKKMVLVRGATHLFEEPGCLEQVAHIAAEWLTGIFNEVKRGNWSVESDHLGRKRA